MLKVDYDCSIGIRTAIQKLAVENYIPTPFENCIRAVLFKFPYYDIINCSDPRIIFQKRKKIFEITGAGLIISTH